MGGICVGWWTENDCKGDGRRLRQTNMSIPIQVSPYVRLMKRLFSGRTSLQDIAYRQEVLCPEEKETFRPPVFLPGQIERVTEYKPTDPWSRTTKDAELAEAISTVITHAPTVAYHIKDAVLFDVSVYAGPFRHSIADKSLYGSSNRKHQVRKAGALSSSYLGTKYFSHWLIDDCSRYLLAEQFGPPISLRSQKYGHG